MSKTNVEAWHDKTSDRTTPRHVVSLCEEDGGEIRILAFCTDEAEARRVGREEANRLGLPALWRNDNGTTETLT